MVICGRPVRGSQGNGQMNRSQQTSTSRSVMGALTSFRSPFFSFLPSYSSLLPLLSPLPFSLLPFSPFSPFSPSFLLPSFFPGDAFCITPSVAAWALRGCGGDCDSEGRRKHRFPTLLASPSRALQSRHEGQVNKEKAHSCVSYKCCLTRNS